MSKVNIKSWKYVEAPEEEQPDPFMTYELEGTHDDGPFHVKVGMEIDGRDAEYEQLGGIDMRWDSEDDAARQRWDDLLVALNETPGLKEDMEARTNFYFATC